MHESAGILADFQALPGNGLTGTGNHRAMAGGKSCIYFFERPQVPDAFAAQAKTRWQTQAKTPLFFMQGRKAAWHYCGCRCDQGGQSSGSAGAAGLWGSG